MISENKITPEKLEESIIKSDFYFLDDGVTTICQLTLLNGFTVIGKSACADPKNFNKELGKKYSKEEARKEAWAFLGYGLREKLHAIEQMEIPKGKITEFDEVYQYVGTKTVTATPMTLGKYNQLRGWEIPKDEDPDKLGYLVQYDNNPNIEGFTGYISWSPKDVFEKSYERFE